MLKYLSTLIDVKLTECDEILEVTNRMLASKTVESIHVKREHGKHRFYIFNEKTGEETYVSLDDKEKIAKLIEYEYYEKLQKIVRPAKYHLKYIRKYLVYKFANRAFLELHPAKRVFLTEAKYSWKYEADSWEKCNYPHLQNLKSGELTKKGERVRSRIEKLVADLLFDLGIPYHYEETIIANGKRYSVDFVLYDVVTDRAVLLECFGMMDDEKYAKKAIEKMNDYIAAGYVLGETFMYIYTSGAFGISLESLKSWLLFRFATARGNKLIIA